VIDGISLFASTGTDGLLIDDAGRAHASAGLHRFTAVDQMAMDGGPR
jgi:hypothetical protein